MRLLLLALLGLMACDAWQTTGPREPSTPTVLHVRFIAECHVPTIWWLWRDQPAPANEGGQWLIPEAGTATIELTADSTRRRLTALEIFPETGAFGTPQHHLLDSMGAGTVRVVCATTR